MELKRKSIDFEADICLVLEGTYPYVSGGVSSWTHDLILMHEDKTFHITTLLPPDAKPKMKYTLPKNVLTITNIYLQKLPRGDLSLKDPHFFEKLEKPLDDFHQKGELEFLSQIIQIFKNYPGHLGHEILLDSKESWEFLKKMYDQYFSTDYFLDFFWSWRALFSGLFSILLSPIPKAKIYHTLCTGYAGLYASKAAIETKRPVILTEHGIYTNERKIEIISAEWLEEPLAQNFSLNQHKLSLKDFWIKTFSSYSKICYEASQKIITLYKGNQLFQIADGADPNKMIIISNGVDTEHWHQYRVKKIRERPTVCLIGRVVPIKDVKTFIRAIGFVKDHIPDIQALVLGNTDEDEEYFEECKKITSYLNLEDNLSFTGKVAIEDYFPSVDVLVLTSISEAQPLVILEAGAAGIPAIATKVGACEEMIQGREEEKIGPGGIVIPLSNPQSTAAAIIKLITDKEFYLAASKNMMERVDNYYKKEDQQHAYHKIYEELGA